MSVLEAPQFLNPVLEGKLFSSYWQRWLKLLPTYLNPVITYTPTITAGSGAFTTVSAAGRYRQIGKLIFIQITITITTNGTAAVSVIASLPFVSVNVTGVTHILAGKATAVSKKGLTGEIDANTNSVIITNSADGTYPGASGETLALSSFYEIP